MSERHEPNESNGKVTVETADQLAAVPVVPGAPVALPPRRYRLDPDELSPKDMKRARVMLGGRNPWELLDDPDDQFTLIMWCLLSRTNPSLTWEQAEETPFGMFDPAVPKDPPQIPLPESSGSGTSRPSVSGSKSARRKRASVPDSASSTA